MKIFGLICISLLLIPIYFALVVICLPFSLLFVVVFLIYVVCGKLKILVDKLRN